MKIIRKDPNPSGAYPPIQSVNYEEVPDGCALWPDELDDTEFYAYNGFVKPTIEDNTVTEFAPNAEAWEAWKASLPPEKEPEPKPEYVTYAELAAAIRKGVNSVE